MRVSWTNLFAVGLSLLCLAHPLHSDLRSPSWQNYGSRGSLLVPLKQEDSPEIRTAHMAPPPVNRDINRFQSSQGLSSYPDRPRFVENVEESKPERTHVEGDNDGVQGSLNEIEIMKKMRLLDKLLSEDSIHKGGHANGIENGIFPEESKRVARQVRKQKPGFFWTLARVTFETINDTRSAIKQISEIITNNIAPDSATESTMTRGSLTATALPSDARNDTAVNEMETTTMRPTSTTPYVITRSNLQSLIRRNVKGLVRLFNIEWKDALNESEVTVKEFQKNLGNQVGVYLRDDPRAY